MEMFIFPFVSFAIFIIWGIWVFLCEKYFPEPYSRQFALCYYKKHGNPPRARVEQDVDTNRWLMSLFGR